MIPFWSGRISILLVKGEKGDTQWGVGSKFYSDINWDLTNLDTENGGTGEGLGGGL